MDAYLSKPVKLEELRDMLAVRLPSPPAARVDTDEDGQAA